MSYINYFDLIKLARYSLMTFIAKKTKETQSSLSLNSIGRKRPARIKKALKAVFKSDLAHSEITGYNPTTLKPLMGVRSPSGLSGFPRALFHIKCLFDLEEFAVYDLYNFYQTEARPAKKQTNHTVQDIPQKINFFYYVRRSIKIFRSHSLLFFRKSFNTERKTNLFFKGFESVSTLSYMWFFEFNLPMLLIKVGFASSVRNAYSLVTSHSCFLNQSGDYNVWSMVKPGDSLFMALSYFYLTKLKHALLSKLYALRRVKKAAFRLFFRRRSGGVKRFKKTRAAELIWAKQKPFKFLEVDARTCSVALLPYKNPTTYYKLSFILWLNYWNYRAVLWKYDT